MQASEFRPAAVSADAPADGQWRRQTDNHGHGHALVAPDVITDAPETAVTVLRERAEVAEQRADDAVTMAERTLGQLVVVQAKLAEAEDRAGDAERDARAAWDHARAALDAAEALRRANAAQWGRGRWARLRAAWRGAEAAGARRTKTWLAVLSVGILLAADVAYWRLGERGQSVAPLPSPSSVRNLPAEGTAPAPSAAGPPASEPTPPTAPMGAIPQSAQETPSAPTATPAPTAAVPQPAPPPTAPAPSTAGPSSPSPAQMPTEAVMSEANRRQIQEALNGLGYYKGPVDGIFRRGTRTAIRHFQRDIKAAATGHLTADEATRLVTAR
jgi:hypothetical protein